MKNINDTVIVATNNPGKIKEIKQILFNYNIKSLKDINLEIEVEETGETFEENAIIKATEISKLTNMPAIADDSGLCVKELNDFPGVKTARFLGENSTKDQRNDYIIEKMKDVQKENRTAKAVTVIAYIDLKNDKKIVCRGEIQGYISNQKKGNNGFGFDEIFELENGKTLAQLSDEEKNKISSRTKALEMLKKEL